jgi:ribosomal protein L9
MGMEMLLIANVPGIGSKYDIVRVDHKTAYERLLPQRLAFFATPAIRRRYADAIRNRAIAND